ncbi:MAG: glycosyltransferase family 2 protein [Firmicutes bacterium]|nr:glycosyltransferase family 2 protein [Bacillota bacterium]
MSRPGLTITYVVKDEEEFFPFSLRSVHNVADEVVVVDNGSRDRTPEIALSFPRVRLYTSLCQDFSALRNLALSKVQTEWVMVLDADEVFYSLVEDVVPRLLEVPEVDGYTCWFYHLMRSFYYMQNREDKDPQYRRIFLFRLTPGVRYVGAVHERLVGLGPSIRDSGLHYVHYGYTKSPVLILERWKHYARLSGRADPYPGVDPEHILDGRPLHPFRRPHPEVIRAYVESRAAELAAQGHKLYRPPPPDPEEELTAQQGVEPRGCT